jgi:hypothetical protein
MDIQIFAKSGWYENVRLLILDNPDSLELAQKAGRRGIAGLDSLQERHQLASDVLHSTGTSRAQIG